MTSCTVCLHPGSGVARHSRDRVFALKTADMTELRPTGCGSQLRVPRAITLSPRTPAGDSPLHPPGRTWEVLDLAQDQAAACRAHVR